MDFWIDIVMTTYNSEKYLAPQIDSILTQSHQRWRLLISDDGSVDNTRAIIHDYCTRYPGHIVDITPECPFHNVSRNVEYLMTHTAAPYVMFADHDDVWVADKISLTWTAMKTAELNYPGTPVLVHTDLKVVDAALGLIDPSYWHYVGLKPTENFSELLFQNVVTGSTTMINRSLAEKGLPLPDGVFLYDWWFALVASKFGRVVSVPKSTIQYRQHDANLVGATRVPRNSIVGTWNYLRQTMARRLERTQGQASAFLTRYGNELDAQTVSTLQAYIALRTRTVMRRRLVGLRYGFFGNSWKTALGMWLLL